MAIINLPVHIVSRLIPSRPDLWVFGAWYGDRYADNSRALFEHLTIGTDIQCWWLTSDTKVFQELRDRGYSVAMKRSLRGYWISARAGVGVISTGLEDLNRFVLPKLVVNLWHGIPLKRIMRLSESFREHGLTRRAVGKMFPFTRYDLPYPIVVSSEWEGEVMKSAFNIDSSAVLATGHPRNDALSMRPIENVARRVIWMPTHREEGQADIATLMRGLREIDPFLADRGLELFVKWHHYHAADNSLEGLQAIRFLDDSDCLFDLYDFLNDTAVLVTDYSSVAFDFLLTGRPILYAPFDLEEYMSSEGRGPFLMDYAAFAAGPICRDWNAVADALESIFNGGDKWQERRRDLALTVHDSYTWPASVHLAQEIAKRCGLESSMRAGLVSP